MSHLRLRPAMQIDLDDIHQLALKSASGLTTLPKSKPLLEKRIQLAVDSFNRPAEKPTNEYYLFVLEESTTGRIIGVSGIEASVGTDAPFYTYKITRHHRVSPTLGIKYVDQLLNLVTDHHGKSELCTLFLDPDYRKSFNGRLLSRGRFLFMANFPERFQPIVIAEIRGVMDKHGIPPFWRSIGEHFFKMPFEQADALSLSTNKQFITDLLSDIPIHIGLLPKTVQAIIGKPQVDSIPALQLLLEEGFQYHDYVDIFDAGPTVDAALSSIKTIHTSKIALVASIKPSLKGGALYLLSNTTAPFCATIGEVMFEEDQVIIDTIVATQLNIQTNTPIRLCPLRDNI